MKIAKLNISNFLGIGAAEVEFNRNGLTLIEGVNHDSPTARSNGAGKSSIYEALLWCLYGKTKRGVNGDSVINNGAESCEVSVSFEAGGVGYVVCRARGKAGATLTFATDAMADLTKGTMKDTQDAIERVIGMSELTFQKATSFGQGDVKPFASLTDAELKRVFEEVLGVEYIAECHRVAKEKATAARLEVAAINSEIATSEREAAYLRENLDTLRKAQTDAHANRQAEVKRLEGVASGIEQEVAGYDFEVRELTAKADALAANIAAVAATYDAANARVAELQREHMRAQSVSQQAELALRNATARLNGAMGDIQSAGQRIGQPCGECGKPYNADDIKPFIEKAGSRAYEAKEEVKRVEQDAQAARAALETATRLLVEAQDAMRSLPHADSMRVEERNLRQMAASAGTNSQRRRTQAENIRQEVEKLKRQGDTYAERLAQVKNDIAMKEADQAVRAAARADVEERAEVMELVADAFGNSGLKSYIFDNVTPELNRLIQEYLNVVNPDIRVEVSTVTKLKSKEEYREKFSVNVETLNGASDYKGNSGGEQQIVNLAIALAHNAITRATAQNAVNCLFLDEPFENLDDAASERVIELCNQIAREVDNVFVISHNQAIKDLVSGRLTVEKSGGKASIQ